MDTQKSCKEVVTVDAEAAKDLICSGSRYLDVRTPELFSEGHVENALNVPYLFVTPEGRVKNSNFLEQVLAVCSKDDHLIVACGTGGRSVPASLELVNAEFKHINNLGGGLSAWIEKGFAVVKPEIEQ